MIPKKQNKLNISFYIISKTLLSTLAVIFCCVLSEHPAAGKHGAPERGACRVPEGAAEIEGGDRWRAQQGCWRTQHKVLRNAKRTDQISTLLISLCLSVCDWTNTPCPCTMMFTTDKDVKRINLWASEDVGCQWNVFPNHKYVQGAIYVAFSQTIKLKSQ